MLYMPCIKAQQFNTIYHEHSAGEVYGGDASDFGFGLGEHRAINASLCRGAYCL